MSKQSLWIYFENHCTRTDDTPENRIKMSALMNAWHNLFPSDYCELETRNNKGEHELLSHFNDVRVNKKDNQI